MIRPRPDVWELLFPHQRLLWDAATTRRVPDPEYRFPVPADAGEPLRPDQEIPEMVELRTVTFERALVDIPRRRAYYTPADAEAEEYMRQVMRERHEQMLASLFYPGPFPVSDTYRPAPRGRPTAPKGVEPLCAANPNLPKYNPR